MIFFFLCLHIHTIHRHISQPFRHPRRSRPHTLLADESPGIRVTLRRLKVLESVCGEGERPPTRRTRDPARASGRATTGESMCVPPTRCDVRLRTVELDAGEAGDALESPQQRLHSGGRDPALCGTEGAAGSRAQEDGGDTAHAKYRGGRILSCRWLLTTTGGGPTLCPHPITLCGNNES